MKEGDKIIIDWPGSEFDKRTGTISGLHLKDVSINFDKPDPIYPQGISLRWRHVKKRD